MKNRPEPLAHGKAVFGLHRCDGTWIFDISAHYFPQNVIFSENTAISEIWVVFAMPLNCRIERPQAWRRALKCSAHTPSLFFKKMPAGAKSCVNYI